MVRQNDGATLLARTGVENPYSCWVLIVGCGANTAAAPPPPPRESTWCSPWVSLGAVLYNDTSDPAKSHTSLLPFLATDPAPPRAVWQAETGAIRQAVASLLQGAMQGNGLCPVAPALLGVMGDPSPFWGMTGAQKWLLSGAQDTVAGAG